MGDRSDLQILLEQDGQVRPPFNADAIAKGEVADFDMHSFVSQYLDYFYDQEVRRELTPTEQKYFDFLRGTEILLEHPEIVFRSEQEMRQDIIQSTQNLHILQGKYFSLDEKVSEEEIGVSGRKTVSESPPPVEKVNPPKLRLIDDGSGALLIDVPDYDEKQRVDGESECVEASRVVGYVPKEGDKITLYVMAGDGLDQYEMTRDERVAIDYIHREEEVIMTVDELINDVSLAANVSLFESIGLLQKAYDEAEIEMNIQVESLLYPVCPSSADGVAQQDKSDEKVR